MKNVFGIIGALLFVASVIVGYFCKFDNADLIAIGLDAFALASTVVAIIKKYKEAGKFSWKLVVVIIGTIVGAAFVAIGGLSDNIFSTLAGAVVGILTIGIAAIGFMLGASGGTSFSAAFGKGIQFQNNSAKFFSVMLTIVSIAIVALYA